MTGTAVEVLVAEDDPVIRMLMVETLEDAGYSVIEARDGAQAVRLLENSHSIGLIVTDFNMPGFNGAEVARKARERVPAVAVVFVSARTDVLAGAGALEPYAVLKKPFTMAELEAEVRKVMAREG